jgi:hypothetical protein
MSWSAIVAALFSPGLVWAVVNGWKHHQRLKLLQHVYDASGAHDARVVAEAMALANGSSQDQANTPQPSVVQARSERLPQEELDRGSQASETDQVNRSCAI